MGNRKVVLFDLGGVLVGSEGRLALQTLLPHLSEDGVLARWHASSAVNRFERGQILPTEFAEAFITEWELRLGGPEFLEMFAGWVTGFYDGAGALLQSLRERHVVACLSNTNAIHWARLHEAPQLFDACFASHLTGFMKPDSEAYRHALRGLGTNPGDVYFFDDLAENIEAARRVGINAFHVRGFRDLAPVLRSLGLHPAAPA